MTSRSRLLKEIKESSKDVDPAIRLAPDGENLLRWSATLKGPEETPFHTGTFVVRFALPESYPLAPPRASFETKIFHPNVHWKTGEICLDILKDAWSPAWTLHSVCRAVLALLSNPEPDSPLNCDAGNMLRARDDIAYWSMARMYTRREAGGSGCASCKWPPIRPDREMDEDERINGQSSARRRENGTGAGGAGETSGKARAGAKGASRGTVQTKENEETKPLETVTTDENLASPSSLATSPDPRAAAAAAAAKRFGASRNCENETNAVG